MTYTELFLLKELLTEIKEGKEIKIDHSTKVMLAEPENYFKNMLSDIDRQKIKSNEPVMYYKLAIEVNK